MLGTVVLLRSGCIYEEITVCGLEIWLYHWLKCVSHGKCEPESPLGGEGAGSKLE